MLKLKAQVLGSTIHTWHSLFHHNFELLVMTMPHRMVFLAAIPATVNSFWCLPYWGLPAPPFLTQFMPCLNRLTQNELLRHLVHCGRFLYSPTHHRIPQ